MKKIGDLMSELGFRDDAPESVKKAFLENLSRVLAEQNAGRPSPTGTREVVATSAKCPVVKAALPMSRNLSRNSPEQLSLFEVAETRKPQKRPRAG